MNLQIWSDSFSQFFDSARPNTEENVQCLPETQSMPSEPSTRKIGHYSRIYHSHPLSKTCIRSHIPQKLPNYTLSTTYTRNQVLLTESKKKEIEDTPDIEGAQAIPIMTHWNGAISSKRTNERWRKPKTLKLKAHWFEPILHMFKRFVFGCERIESSIDCLVPLWFRINYVAIYAKGWQSMSGDEDGEEII